jgi:hypothetical protein
MRRKILAREGDDFGAGKELVYRTDWILTLFYKIRGFFSSNNDV